MSYWGAIVYLGELQLKNHIDRSLLDFIKLYIDNFEKLDIIRFYGLNPLSKIVTSKLVTRN